jgi:hypothetical protein
LQLGLGVEARTKDAIHDLLKGLARMPYFGSQLGGDVIVESESGAHIPMLCVRNHDVKREKGKVGGRDSIKRVPQPDRVRDVIEG